MIQSPFIFLAWVSLLPSLAYRLLYQNKSNSFFFCLQCNKPNSLQQHIALLSYFAYPTTQCCQQKKPFYAFIFDFFALGTFIILWQISHNFFAAHFLFISAMLLVIQTDMQAMLISRFTTIYLIPFAFAFSYLHQIPVSISSSICGALFGFILLWTTKKIFFYFTRQDGLGDGDIDLLATIGAFTGILGAWVSLSIGSVVGTILISIYKVIYPQSHTNHFPFGPFLAVGAIIFSLFPTPFVKYFLS